MIVGVTKQNSMFGLFKSKAILSPEDTEFQLETFKWLLRNFGGADFYEHAKLVLPTREYFPSKVENPEQAAFETFLAVKRYALMEDWPCRFVVQEADIDTRVGRVLSVQNAPQNPLGTFSLKDNREIEISYNPNLLNNPTQLVATLAHELAHYLTATTAQAPPGGWENWEFATDVAAIFLGFGVFLANSAFNFHQFSDGDLQGWQSSRSGYLSTEECVYSLALFLELKKIPGKVSEVHLKPGLRKLLKRCVKEINQSGFVEELARIEFVGVTDKVPAQSS
jgi:hypothetical protein